MVGRGLFVVFEGGDRVGKSTQVRALAAALAASGIDHIVTHEPGDTQVGVTIRRLLLDPASHLNERCEALLYAADKAQHVGQVVEPALASGRVVVCDRYIDSMLAYQGAGRDLDMAELSAMAGWATGGLLPDLTVLLDVDPDRAVGKLVHKDRLEAAGAEFHARVRDRFLALAQADPQRYLVLPGLTSVRGIAAQIRQAVGERLGRELVEPPLHDPTERRGPGAQL